MRKLRTAIAALIISAVPLTALAGIDGAYLQVRTSTQPDVVEFYETNCLEDEVVFQVVHDPYGIAKTELGCVPGDNVPWDPDGFR